MEVRCYVTLKCSQLLDPTHTQLPSSLLPLPQNMLQSQDANAQKVNSIDQSSTHEAVRKSLERNPDIAQEKDRLLGGEWVWPWTVGW